MHTICMFITDPFLTHILSHETLNCTMKCQKVIKKKTQMSTVTKYAQNITAKTSRPQLPLYKQHLKGTYILTGSSYSVSQM